MKALSRSADLMAASPHVRKAALFDKAASATYLGSILVLNAEGKSPSKQVQRVWWTTASLIGIFQSTPGKLQPGPLCGRPLCITTSWLLDEHSSQSQDFSCERLFAGIVLIDIQLEYFQKLFSELLLGTHGAQALKSHRSQYQ